jgi:predicted esterase YcpF (UPF0227 family)
MSMLTAAIIKDRLTHHTSFETIDQHLFARLSMAAYYFENQEYVQSELFNPMIELEGFVLDRELSTEEHSVFHNSSKKETVIAYRGTSNLSDVATDSHVAMGRERHTARYKRSEAVFEKARDKYDGSMSVTGHSLGGGISLHIAEKYDVEGHHYNPAISATQVFSKDHYDNKTTQQIYHTELDPVSVGAHVIADHQPRRKVHRIDNDPDHHAHAVENFFSNKATRTDDNQRFQVRKENLRTTVERHQKHFKRLYDAYQKVQDIDEYLDSLDSDASVATRLPKALPRAIALAKRGVTPAEFDHQVARDLNPFFGFIPDPDYQWTDRDVITPLYRLGQYMRTADRRRMDNLLALEPKETYQNFTEQDEHHLLSSAGVRYVEVMGQDLLPHMRPRRRPTEGMQIVQPSMLIGAPSLTEERLAAALQGDIPRTPEGPPSSHISDLMSSSEPRRRRPTEGMTIATPTLQRSRSEISSVLSSRLSDPM